jgi:hypothetical protein
VPTALAAAHRRRDRGGDSVRDELTAGASVASNLALLRGNARLAAELAVALARQGG